MKVERKHILCLLVARVLRISGLNMHQRWLNRRYMSFTGDWLFWSRHLQNFGDFTRILDELCRLLFHWMLTTIWTISHLTANAGSDATQVPIQCDRRESLSCMEFHICLQGTSQNSIVSEVEAATVFGLASLVCEVRPWCWNIGSMARWKNSMLLRLRVFEPVLGGQKSSVERSCIAIEQHFGTFLHDASIIEIVVTLSPKGGLVELPKLELIEIYSSGIHADTILIGPLHADKTSWWLSSFKTSWGNSQVWELWKSAEMVVWNKDDVI